MQIVFLDFRVVDVDGKSSVTLISLPKFSVSKSIVLLNIKTH